MKTRSQYHALGLALCACLTLQSAHAVSTITQTFDFDEEVTSWTATPQETHYFYFPASYQTNVNPFNTTLGVLESVTLHWTYTASFAGYASSDPSASTVGLTLNGQFSIGGAQYAGNGTGGGAGAPPNGALAMTASPFSTDTEFTAAQAGVSYNPAIWTALAGSTPWSAAFTIGNGSFNYNDVASGTFSSNLGLEVNYHYTPSPVPEPASVLGSIALLSGGMFFRRRKLAA